MEIKIRKSKRIPENIKCQNRVDYDRSDKYPPEDAVGAVVFLVPFILEHPVDKWCTDHAPAREKNKQNADYICYAKNEHKLHAPGFKKSHFTVQLLFLSGLLD